MKKSKIRILLLLALLLLLLATQSAQAMHSTNYRLDWFTPLNTSSGGASHSTGYAVNFTLGQTVIGQSSSPQYGVGLGYWQEIVDELARIFLPLISRTSH